MGNYIFILSWRSFYKGLIGVVNSEGDMLVNIGTLLFVHPSEDNQLTSVYVLHKW